MDQHMGKRRPADFRIAKASTLDLWQFNGLDLKRNGAGDGRSVANGTPPDAKVWDTGSDPSVGHSPNDPHERVRTSDPVALTAVSAKPIVKPTRPTAHHPRQRAPRVITTLLSGADPDRAGVA